ncbi:MAG: hypothetical protein IJH07_01495 [Ruminococcus sp.]|nr:hypothetical protein [Ruminococcus sp.]
MRGGFYGMSQQDIINAANRAVEQQMDTLRQAQTVAAQNTSGAWVCSCGQHNTGKFCENCGSPRV